MPKIPTIPRVIVVGILRCISLKCAEHSYVLGCFIYKTTIWQLCRSSNNLGLPGECISEIKNLTHLCLKYFQLKPFFFFNLNVFSASTKLPRQCDGTEKVSGEFILF